MQAGIISTQVTDEYGDSLGNLTSGSLGSSAFNNDTITFSARWTYSAASQGVENTGNEYALAAIKNKDED